MPISVWYVRGNRLVPTFRSVAYPATAAAAVEALVAGPGASAGKDVRTLWRRPEQIAATTTRAGSVLVDLAPEVREISPAEQVLAIAQLVLTLTEVPGVGTVEFQIDGKRVSVPRGDGSQTDAPVSRDDYRALTGSG
jgi:spore germination protein GerM